MDPTLDFLLLCSRMAFVPLFLRAGKGPHRISCWWQPSNRWVTLLHLPAHLHDPRFLAPLVAYFGSLVSTSYPANFKDNKVILVLVKDYTIANIPHILPVSGGNTVIPVRTQVISEEKVREEGIINTADLSPVNSVMQTRPADLYTSVLLSELYTNTKDKGKQTGASSVSTVDIDSDWSVQGRNTLLGVRMLDQVQGFSLTPPPDPTSLVVTTQGKPVLGQDSDLSAKERSHQYPTSDSIAPTKSTALSLIQTSFDPAVSKEAGLVGKRNIDNVKDGNSQHIDLSNQNLSNVSVSKHKSLQEEEGTANIDHVQEGSTNAGSLVKVSKPFAAAGSHKDNKEDSPCSSATLGKKAKEFLGQTYERVHGNLGTYPQPE